MTTVTFDTLKFANRLKAAGVPEKQAEAEAEILAEALEVNAKNLATKEDLVMLEQRIVIKIGGVIFAATGILMAYMQVRS